MSKVNTAKQVEELKHAIYAENAMSIYYRYLSFLIRNGKIKKACYFFSETASANEEELIKYLNSLGVNNFKVEDKYRFNIWTLKSFSLIGLINLGLELINSRVKAYKDLLKSTDRKDLFKKLLTNKKRERKFLRKEMKFHNKNEMSITLQKLTLLR